jgi:hypothetical protein
LTPWDEAVPQRAHDARHNRRPKLRRGQNNRNFGIDADIAP